MARTAAKRILAGVDACRWVVSATAVRGTLRRNRPWQHGDRMPGWLVSVRDNYGEFAAWEGWDPDLLDAVSRAVLWILPFAHQPATIQGMAQAGIVLPHGVAEVDLYRRMRAELRTRAEIARQFSINANASGGSHAGSNGNV